MIRQYLLQTNKSATVAKSIFFSHLNKASAMLFVNGQPNFLVAQLTSRKFLLLETDMDHTAPTPVL